MGVFKRLDERLQKERLGHVQFQTFVCWMLFVCALLALLIPTGLVVAEIRDFGCVGEEFTIVSHYGSVSWMIEMFSDFKVWMTEKRNDGGISFNVCYRLVISETAPLDRSYKPTIYQPQLYYWLNISEAEWRAKKPSKRSDKYFVRYQNKSCTSTTEIPMGLIIREEFKNAFRYNEPIDFNDIIEIAQLGWKNYTELNMGNKSSAIINESTLILGMGHPNVTSSGFLTLYLGLDAKDSTGNLRDQESIQVLTNSTYEIAPNDLFHLHTLRDFPRQYLHAAIGFENDVVQYNKQNLNNPNLTFIYFKKTFWVDYPICVLEDAPWVGGRQKKLGHWFLNFTTQDDKLEELLDYGMRPAGWDSSEFKFTSNGTDIDVPGINLNITKNESLPLNPHLTIQDFGDLLAGWRNVKRPAYVLLLQDVSKDVTKSVSTTKTRWVYAKRALPLIVQVLEDRARIQLKCFSSEAQSPTLKCGGKTDFNSTATLQSTRRPLLTFLENSITTTSQKNTGFYSELTSNIRNLRQLQKRNPSYNYFIIAISGDDKTRKSERDYKINTLTNITLSNNKTDEVHVFPILFFGTESGEKNDANITWETMETVATNTNGRKWSADSDLEEVFETVRYYF